MKNIDRVWIILGIVGLGNSINDHWSGGILGLIAVVICNVAIFLDSKD